MAYPGSLLSCHHLKSRCPWGSFLFRRLESGRDFLSKLICRFVGRVHCLVTAELLGHASLSSAGKHSSPLAKRVLVMRMTSHHPCFIRLVVDISLVLGGRSFCVLGGCWVFGVTLRSVHHNEQTVLFVYLLRCVTQRREQMKT